MSLGGGFSASGAREAGAVRLVGARIGGQLSCIGADLRGDSGPALLADGLQVDQDMYLCDGFTAVGGVNLIGTHIGGSIDCTGAGLRGDFGPALIADALRVGEVMYLCGGFTGSGAGDVGAVRLVAAEIGITLGYCYKPWRALLFRAAVVVISCLLAVGLGSHGALVQTGKTAAPRPVVHGDRAGQRRTGP